VQLAAANPKRLALWHNSRGTPLMEKITPLITQSGWLFILAIPVACLAWTVTHEEIFREAREFCIRCSKEKKVVLLRKFFYVFTCEYCFSHYIALFFVALTKFTLLYEGMKGYFIAWLSLVWIANVYMSVFSFIRIGIKREKTEISYTEEKIGN